jgi:arylsulfatase A-like enzyme
VSISKPNFIFILADDLGYADLGCFGSPAPFDVAPNLDRLARDGMRFTQSYSNSPVCSPTRFALLTAQYQYRFRGAAEEPIGSGTRGSSVLGLPAEAPTVPSRLCEAGYNTALIGKWHLGFPPVFGPRKSGFNYFFGALAGAVDYFSHVDPRGVHDLWENEVEIHRDGYLTDLFSERAAQWISEQSSDQPFSLNLHYTAPHWPWETRDDRAESTRIGSKIAHTDGGSLDTYWRMIHHMDEGIGRVLAALEAKELTQNTLVVFTSDNGGERYSKNWPFMGGKMDLLEGGTRVPVIARWPHRIAANVQCETPTISMDWSATMLAAAGIDCAASADGADLSELFSNPGTTFDRALYWRMNHRSQRAMREGAWKYLAIGDHEYLFDIVSDPRERANLAKREPARLSAMREGWQRWAETMPGIPEDAKVHLVYSDAELPSVT